MAKNVSTSPKKRPVKKKAADKTAPKKLTKRMLSKLTTLQMQAETTAHAEIFAEFAAKAKKVACEIFITGQPYDCQDMTVAACVLYGASLQAQGIGHTTPRPERTCGA